jgi:hypothetical protein
LAWTIEFEKDAIKELKKLDRPTKERIINFLKDRVANSDDPRQLGKALTGDLKYCGDTAWVITVLFAILTMIKSKSWCCELGIEAESMIEVKM